MLSDDEQLRRLVYDLRQLIYGLARVDDPDVSRIAYSLEPTRLLEASPQQNRADAWLAIMESVLRLKPGDKLEVDWHEDGVRLATLTYKSSNPQGPVTFG